jgi:hypothetical protein
LTESRSREDTTAGGAPGHDVRQQKHPRVDFRAATINPPSTTDATATGHGSKAADTSAMAPHPAARVTQLGRRSSSNTIIPRFSWLAHRWDKIGCGGHVGTRDY